MHPHNPLIIQKGALTGLASIWGDTATDSDQPASAIEVGGQLTHHHLDLLDERLTLLRWIDDMRGGADIIEYGVAQFRNILIVVDNTVYSGAVSARLFATVTAAARLAGWLQFDALYHAGAQKYFIAALRASVHSLDVVEGANVLGFLSKQAADCGHAWEAITLAEDAEEKSKHAATPRVRSLLAANKAHAYAKAGDSQACAHALNDAEHWLDKANPGIEDPEWLYYFDEHFLAGLTASCWVTLGQPRPARRLFETFWKERAPYYVRERAIRRVDSARAYLLTNDLEPACDDLRAAANLCHHISSPRTVQLVRAAREAMAPYNSDPRVQDLNRFIDPLPT